MGLKSLPKPHIEPRQTTSGLPEWTFILSTGTFLKPIERQDPILYVDEAEELLLVVQAGSDVVAHEGEETGNGEGLVAVA